MQPGSTTTNTMTGALTLASTGEDHFRVLARGFKALSEAVAELG